MHYDELQKIWESIFMQLGYRESERNNWVSETQELIIVLNFKVNAKEKDFYIDIGIIIKKWYRDHSLKEPVFEDHDIGQGLYTILYYMGELEYYLNNLFCYDPDINTDAEVIDNSKEIAMLFLTKVIPHIEQLDAYALRVEDFEKATTWEPFLKYFRPAEDNNKYFYWK
ncbi:DUF4304 domain-containing protein [Niastella caeni]|uniref:DUF4304 domain-containing protein n=1 Tax=Niastella caeni TaxID=2569763 RepID=A0A4S8HIB0_9BACT|nr:DUF4304 domain-containing protein [Niastella caeni]THU34948.1 DUF4304 domain-containing protein [Niastella caeni]